MKMFTNRHHAEWFFSSLVMLALFVAANYQEGYRVQLYVGYIIYAIISMESAITTMVEKRKSEYYSVDCIWFNGVVSLAFLFFYLNARGAPP